MLSFIFHACCLRCAPLVAGVGRVGLRAFAIVNNDLTAFTQLRAFECRCLRRFADVRVVSVFVIYRLFSLGPNAAGAAFRACVGSEPRETIDCVSIVCVLTASRCR